MAGPAIAAPTSAPHIPAQRGSSDDDTPRTRWKAAFGGSIAQWAQLGPRSTVAAASSSARAPMLGSLGQTSSGDALAAVGPLDGDSAGGSAGSGVSGSGEGGGGAATSGPRSGRTSVPLPGAASAAATHRQASHGSGGGGGTKANPFSSRNAPAYRYAVVHTRGRRKANEDRFAVVSSFLSRRDGSVYAVFDGHGGHAAAEFAAQHLCSYMEESWMEEDVAGGITRAFLAAEDAFERAHRPGAAVPPLALPADAPAVASLAGAPATATSSSSATSTGAAALPAALEYDGTTALTLTVLGSELVLAHVGDSRALLVSATGEVAGATEDHTTAVEAERARLASLDVDLDGDGRIRGVQRLSRSIGDLRFKPDAVPAAPTVLRMPIAGYMCAVLATDGVWDVMANADVARVVAASLLPADGAVAEARVAAGDAGSDSARTLRVSEARLAEPGTVAARIIAEAQLRGAGDNITVLVVDFTRPTAPTSRGAAISPWTAMAAPGVVPGSGGAPGAM